MPKSIVLDSTPLGVLTQRAGKPVADACRKWLASCLAAGSRVYVPEIADYEVRRELLRANKTAGIARLDAMKRTARYLPITTDAMILAAQLWAQARQQGAPTADPQALDGDVILAAQALTLGVPPAEIIIATSNVAHVARFVAADLWQNIVP